MKKYVVLSLFAIFLFEISGYSQDAKAKEILTKVSDKTKSAQTIKADFKSTLQNTAEDIEESRNGKLLSVGEKYRIIMDDMEVLNDGKSIYTILEEAEEIQINSIPEEGEMADLSNPTDIATLWEKGYKYEYKSSETINGKSYHLIHLYPKDPSDKDFHTIKLYVDPSSYTLKRIFIKGKSGTDIIYDISNFKINQSISQDQLTFKKSNYQNFELIDLR